MIKKIIAGIFLGHLFLAGFSQGLDKEKLDKYFDALDKNDKFMGSVVISQNSQLVYTRSIGFSDLESKIKSNENTKCRVGSISKTFTSTLIFKAVEEGKLTLSTTLSKFYPSIKNSDSITIGNLLNHRSGINNFTNHEEYYKYNTEKKTETEMIEIVKSYGSDFKPDSKAEYSNSNYLLLSYILQKIYNKTYAQLLEEKILKPVGLKNTYVGSKIKLTNNESNSYKMINSWIKQTETDASVTMGAGNIVSTPGDLTKFAEALFTGKVISINSVEQMKTIKEGYGMGLFQVPFYEMKGYSHTGGIDGFNSVFVYFPNEKVSCAITGNGSNYSNNDILIALLSAVFDKPYKIPGFLKYEVTSEELDKYLGNYSSKEMPLKITISKKDKTLMAQATGQGAFALEAVEKDKFKFDQAKIEMEFNPTENRMILRQGGYVFNYVK